jgi:hypothetical protein
MLSLLKANAFKLAFKVSADRRLAHRDNPSRWRREPQPFDIIALLLICSPLQEAVARDVRSNISVSDA